MTRVKQAKMAGYPCGVWPLDTSDDAIRRKACEIVGKDLGVNAEPDNIQVEVIDAEPWPGGQDHWFGAYKHDPRVDFTRYLKTGDRITTRELEGPDVDTTQCDWVELTDRNLRRAFRPHTLPPRYGFAQVSGDPQPPPVYDNADVVWEGATNNREHRSTRSHGGLVAGCWKVTPYKSA